MTLLSENRPLSLPDHTQLPESEGSEQNPSLSLPDHTQLPESDGTFVKNFQEHPQSILLTESLEPILRKLHPDGQYCIGQDCGIYWRLAEPPEPLPRGAEAPDWFYVPHVAPTLNGELRRSYVMWQEIIVPLIALEFVSGSGREERDRTPYRGKFWVYEQALRIPFYGIYEVKKASLEMYRLAGGFYELMSANERDRYFIEPLGVELGLWQGLYKNLELPWLRWWDGEGNLLLSGGELAQEERLRAERASQLAQEERLRAESAAQLAEEERLRAERAEEENARLRERLASLGIDPDTL